MNIDSIQNGIVIDHITAGLGMTIYRLLKLDELNCSVALIKNASSGKMGKKPSSRSTRISRWTWTFLAMWTPASPWT